jgi:hypothetical protein
VPQVNIKHQNIKGDGAKKPPKRDPVPEGTYAAIIMKAPLKATNHDTPLAKIAVEFQLLYTINEDGSKDDSIKSRRVFQDFILEPDDAMPDMSATWLYELRMLLDATGVEFTDEGFNSDHLVNKSVRITVKQRSGGLDDDGEPRIFTNVKKIDSLDGSADDEDLV